MHFFHYFCPIFKSLSINPLGSAPKTEAVVVLENTSNAVRILQTEDETYEEDPEHVADVALDNKNRVMFRVKCRNNDGRCAVVKTTGWFAVYVSINEFDLYRFVLYIFKVAC